MQLTMLESLLIYLSHAFAAVNMAPLKYSKRKTYLIWGIWIAAAMTLPLILQKTTTSDKTGISPIVVFMLLFCTQAMLYFLTTKGRILERVFLLLSYAVIFTSCMSIVESVQRFIPQNNSWIRLLIYGLLLFGILIIYFKKFMPVFKQSASYIHKEWVLLFVLMVLFFLAIMSWSIFPNTMNDFTLKQIVTFWLLLTVFAVSYAIIFISAKNIAEAARAKQMKLHLELLSAQVNAQSEAVEEARRNRHDIRHHNRTMLSLAEKGELSELVQYLRDVTAGDSKNDEKVWCENNTLNSILSVYSAKAADKNIKTEILAEAEQSLAVRPSDLVAIVANLFENAINGAEKSGAKEPVIRIRIFRKSDKLIINIKNSCITKLHYPDALPKEMYDVGIYSILKSIEGYEGESAFAANDGYFTAVILLNLPE